MGRRAKKPTPSSSLYEDAYRWQQGEFHPEHHQANVERLRQKYPQHALSEIDSIYRQACRIDLEVKERVGAAQLTQHAREELLDWLERRFYGFSRTSFQQAIDRAESV
jgi:hypothetical protein